jgi:hypothetical protein
MDRTGREHDRTKEWYLDIGGAGRSSAHATPQLMMMAVP